MLRGMRAFGVACAVVCLTAQSGCGSSGSTTDSGSSGGILGAWVLTAVNGNSELPVQISGDASSRLLLDSETLTLSSGGLFSDVRKTTLADISGNNDATNQTAGTYTTTPTGVAFNSTNDLGVAITVQATITGNTMVKPDNGNNLTYVKH